MNRANTDKAANGAHLMDEADIGSGGKTPAERETDELIRQIPALPESDSKPEQPQQEQEKQERNQAASR